MVLVLALLIGVVAGLRAFVAPAAVSWAAYLGWVRLADTPLAFMEYAWTPWILTALVLVEFVTDQLPATPNRTVPVQFGARILTGAGSGAALGAPFGLLIPGLIAGISGAVIGTLGGRAARAKLADALRNDRPAAVIEDAVALSAAALIVVAVR
jgi:uncharacterized membrane protein